MRDRRITRQAPHRIDRLRDKNSVGHTAKADDVTALCNRHAAVCEGLHLWLAGGAKAARFDAQKTKRSEQLRSAA